MIATRSGCAAGRSDDLTCTNGFPSRDRLTSDVVPGTGSSTRLIPEMNFVCSGSIVGFTVAMNRKKEAKEYPIIQIWRPDNCSQSITVQQQSRKYLYHRVGVNIPIHEVVCVGGLVTVSELSEVFHCKLNESVQVSVQPGDILGIELPQGNSLSLMFAKVLKGPTNFIFEPSHSLLNTAGALLPNRTSTNQMVPQIMLEVESDNGEILL